MTLDHLPPQQRERELRLRAAEALRLGRITQAEHDHFLERELGPAPASAPAAAPKPSSSSRHARLAVLLVVLLLGVASLILWTPDTGLAGLVTFEEVGQQAHTTSANYSLDATNLTSFAVSGTLTNGSGAIRLHAGDRTLRVWEGSVPPAPRVTTDKASYALGEAVLITVAAENYTLWLRTPEGESLPIDAYNTTTPGEFTLDALIEENGSALKVSTMFTVRSDTDSALDILRDPAASAAVLDGACIDTCELDPTGGAPLVLEITLSDGASLNITGIAVGRRENEPPVQVRSIPDLTVRVGERMQLNLSTYFADADGEALLFEISTTPEARLDLNGTVMAVTGMAAGDVTTQVYASDLHALVASNRFTITVLPPLADPQNASPNSTGVDTTILNGTGNGTSTDAADANATDPNATDPTIPALNTTNVTAQNSTSNATYADCSDPDPNLRPLECLRPQEYFQDQTIYITTTERKPTARITPIGNLLLTGEVIAHDTFTPRAGDYVIAYEDDSGTTRTTVWFDSETGDLHLRGGMHEENANNEPAPGSFVLRNKKGIVLLWANAVTGDVYLRGNVIANKKAIEVTP